MARRCLSRSAQLLLVLFALSTVVNAQDNTQEVNLHRLLQKHSLKGVLPRPKLPVNTSKLMPGTRHADAEPLVFTDRVWFPGEWEDVQAVVVTLDYVHKMPGFENYPNYSAVPVISDYALYYFLNSEKGTIDEIGIGPYFTELQLDILNDRNMMFLYVIDAIQKAGVEAWVRIEDERDAEKVEKTMKRLKLKTDNIHFFVSGGNSFWFRDCGPICFYYGDEDNLAMLDFQYGLDRPMDDMLPTVLHQWKGIPNYKCTLAWEGGNCLVDGVGGLMTSTAVYRSIADTLSSYDWDGKNYKTIAPSTKSAITEEQANQILSGLLGQRELTVVDTLTHDGGTGHVDLYADAIDENGFLFAKMPDIYSTWNDYAILKYNVPIMLGKQNFWGTPYIHWGDVPFPAKNDGSAFESEKQYEQYTRTYANHLQVNGSIIQPCFSAVGDDGMPTADWDRANVEEMMKIYPGYKFYCVDMRSLDGDGGSIHCITKQIPTDNPVRILHKCLHGNVSLGTLENVPFSAVITNKSGIREARLYYCVGETGEWKQADMTANGNRWYCTIPATELTDGQRVYYFIEATSNNDKTVTKPVTAYNGGYYYFLVDNAKAYTADAFDFSTEPMPKEKITFELDTRWLTEDKSPVYNPTGISEIAVDKTVNASRQWYTIDGRQLSAKPTAKGIYIYNGKKYIVK